MTDALRLLVVFIPLLLLYILMVVLSKRMDAKEARKSKERKDAAVRELAKTYAEISRQPPTIIGTGPTQVAAANRALRENIQKAQAQKRAVRERESSRSREFEDTSRVEDAIVLDLFKRNDPPAAPSYPSADVGHDIPATSHASSHSNSHDSHSSHDSFSSSSDSGSFGGGDSGGGSSGGDW